MTLAARIDTQSDDLFAPAANDAMTPRQRHFAAAQRWAKQIPLEKAPEDKRRAHDLMMANLRAALAGEGIKR